MMVEFLRSYHHYKSVNLLLHENLKLALEAEARATERDAAGTKHRTELLADSLTDGHLFLHLFLGSAELSLDHLADSILLLHVHGTGQGDARAGPPARRDGITHTRDAGRRRGEKLGK